jgi:hypothetical protein
MVTSQTTLAADQAARAARVGLAAQHGFASLHAITQAGGDHPFAHGSAGVPRLAAGVREQGFAAIDALGAYLRSLWPANGVGQSLENEHLQRYVDLLGLHEILPQLLPRIRARDVASLIDASAAQLKRNPMLVVLAAEMAQLEATAGPAAGIFPFRHDPAAQAELRDAIVYSALMEAIGLECLLAPKPTSEEERRSLVQARLFELLEAKRRGVDWKSVCNLFEVIKIELVVKPMRQRLRSKQGLDDSSFDDSTGDGLTLQLNVLDAMYGDTLLGNDDNAECGFELMCQTSDKAPEPLLGEAINDEWSLDGRKMGVARMHIAFNEAWVSLYSSWNGAFCSNYADLMYAKLYNPGVAGTYLDVEHTAYFFSRVCTLYVHLHLLVFSRLATGRRDVRVFNWEDPALRAVWGRINRVAGDAYQQRVAAALEGDPVKLIGYKAWRAAKLAMWLPLREMIKEARRLDVGLDAVADSFRRLAESKGAALSDSSVR